MLKERHGGGGGGGGFDNCGRELCVEKRASRSCGTVAAVGFVSMPRAGGKGGKVGIDMRLAGGWGPGAAMEKDETQCSTPAIVIIRRNEP